MMMTISKRILSLVLVSLFTLAITACEAPTTGTEVYDGDAETQDPVPEEMEEHAEEERQDTTFDEDSDY
jgi:hypothetical protein